MSIQVDLVVRLTFSDPITDTQELVNNVAYALFSQADRSYLAPEEEKAVTESITVSMGDVVSQTIDMR